MIGERIIHLFYCIFTRIIHDSDNIEVKEHVGSIPRSASLTPPPPVDVDRKQYDYIFNEELKNPKPISVHPTPTKPLPISNDTFKITNFTKMIDSDKFDDIMIYIQVVFVYPSNKFIRPHNIF